MAEKQYVVFKLSNERYCADIANVGSITEFDDITKVPNTPSYIEGVINLRGSYSCSKFEKTLSCKRY